MAGLIDVAYVEILPDLKKFDKQATKQIKASLEDAAKEADKATKEIGESLSDSVKDGTDKAKVWLNKLGQEIREVDGRVTIKTVVDGEEITKIIKRDIQGRFRDERGKFVSAGELAGLGIVDGLNESLGSAGKNAAKSAGASIAKAFGAAIGPAIGVLAFQGTQLAGAIGPAVVAIGASIPAAVAVGGAAIGTLTLGFMGLDKAIDNFDDDKKFQEALKNLSPAAGRFATELRNLLPVLKSIRNAAQEGIFKGFEGQVTSLVTTLQGPLRAGLNSVGRSIQSFVKEMFELAKSNLAIDALNKVFASTARIIDGLAPAVQIFSAGLLTLVTAALPFVEKLSAAFGQILAAIGNKLAILEASGALNEFFNKALETLSQLGRIALDVGRIFISIFTAAGPSGERLLDVVEKLAEEFANLLSDPRTIEALTVAFIALGEVLTFNLRVLASAGNIGRAVGEAIAEIVNWAKKAAVSIGDFGKSVGEWFSSAWDSVVAFFVGIGEWFSKLPGRISAFLSALPGVIANAFVLALGAALRAVGMGIGLILSFFIELPGLIGSTLISLGTAVVNFFVNLWSSVSTLTVNAWNSLLAWFAALPGRVVAAISSLPGILSSFFVNLWNDVKTWAINGWNSVIGWIAGVPGRLASMASNFYNSGINLIRGFFNGLTSGATGFASSVGNSIFGAFKSGLNWAIRQINSGIASVDDILPGSLPRIPQLAYGGIATGSVLANIGEAGDEVILPLSGQRGRKTMEMLRGEDGQSGRDGVRVWSNASQQPLEATIVIQSDGSRLADLLVEVLGKAIRIRGGNVQKVLGKPQAGVA